ncbi:hypothetical protein SSX86_009765 [Deinandra increscens subsp. villosa]|uniref:Protein BIG GRAIN 1-like B n=1 Tax=Deinandra increscens subsp. villosa TaxID=3103831 RepID=A0AAP0DEB4_9ASTR
MNTPDGNCRYQPPPHRRKTPSFSSSLLDSILRSIDETNDGEIRDGGLQVHGHESHDHNLMLFANPEPKRSGKIHLINEPKQIPSLRRAIMIDQWMETHNNNNKNNHRNGQASRKFSSDSVSSSGTTTFTPSTTSSETETPSTHRSLPNSFTISRKTAEAVFLDDTPNNKRETKFMKSTKLRAMKIYGDLKKVKQPISSPGRSRISEFIYSLFASSSSSSSKKKTKAKIEESMQNFRSLHKSRSTKPDATMTCTSFSRSCMSKKQHSNGVKRSVRFYPENDAVILDRKSVHDRDADSMAVPKYERRWFAEKNYTKNYRNFRVNVEEDDEDVYENEDEDDLFELEIVGGVGTCSYRQELPVFETTDLRKIRI